MTCLSDTEIQTVVDAEATAAQVAHAASCGNCRDRVDARRRDMAMVTDVLTTPSVSEATTMPALSARVQRAISDAQAPRGATALRAAPPSSSWSASNRSRWGMAVAMAAVIVLVVFGLLPKLGAPTKLSASEVLGRSLKTISGTTGVETLEYQLFIAGEMPGPHRIEHLVDHDHPGRYRFANYGPDGILESAIGQDPAGQHRVQLIRVDGHNYIIDINAAGAPKLSLVEMGQALIESTITMMQSTSDQNLSIVNTPEGRQYVVDIPAVTPSAGAAMFDLYHARAVINDGDFRIQEFEASGSVLRQPYSISFKLIKRTVRPSATVPGSEFAIPAGTNDTVILGAADRDPVSDVLTTVLRELGRVRGH